MSARRLYERKLKGYRTRPKGRKRSIGEGENKTYIIEKGRGKVTIEVKR